MNRFKLPPPLLFPLQSPSSSSTSATLAPSATSPTATATSAATAPINKSADRKGAKPLGTSKKHGVIGARLSVQRCAVFALLEQLSDDNEQYFAQQCNGSSSSYAKRLQKAYAEILAYIPAIQSLVRRLQEIAPKYDYDANTPGNGFRSLVCVCDIIVLHLITVLRASIEQRETLMFRALHYCLEIESYCEALKFTLFATQQIINTAEQLANDSLFPPLNDDYTKYANLMRSIQDLDSSCFYGRPLGFQFSPSVGRIFRFIGVILATYSLSWEKGHSTLGSLINSGRFILSPEQRAARIVKVTREADVEFCKGFWNLSELGNVPKFFCPNMAINELRELNFIGPITMLATNGRSVRIPEPSSYSGVRPVRIRILSYGHREGLSPPGSSSHSMQPASPYLLFHCHGGGYVATSSKSHETYLRTWAKLLNCPVVSVDYSLAPENPYPRPTEEVLYAYAYLIKNPAEFGWTGEKICMVGDSAGGNLIMSVCLRLIQMEISRKPDGLVLVYTPFLFQYLPSPSRLLSFMDPLLHMGVVLRCVEAYTRNVNDENQVDSCSTKGKNNCGLNGHKSLLEYFEQVQRAQKNSDSLNLEGSSSIVSLVNLTPENNAPPRSPPAKAAKSETLGNDDDSNLDDGCASVSGVQVDADPLSIHLSSSVYHRQLIRYLSSHPLTKHSLVVRDPAGHVMWNGDDGDGMMAQTPTTDDGADGDIDDRMDESTTPCQSNGSSPKATNTCPNSDSSARRRDENANEPKTKGVHRANGMAADRADVGEQQRHDGSMNFPTATTGLAGADFGEHLMPQPKGSLSKTVMDRTAIAAAYAFDNISQWWLQKYAVSPSSSNMPMDDTSSSSSSSSSSTPSSNNDKHKLNRLTTPTPTKHAQQQQDAASPSDGINNSNGSSNGSSSSNGNGNGSGGTNETDSFFEKLLKREIPREPLISPMYASGDQLRQLPPMWFIACHMDPLLDDTITFARKVRANRGAIRRVDLLDSLPHGFLNFTLMSPECREGAKLCLNRIKEALGICTKDTHDGQRHL